MTFEQMKIFLESAHGRTQRLDGASDIVAQDHRLAYPHRAEAAMVEIMQVGSADAAGLRRDLDLFGTGRLGFAFLNPQIAGSMDDDGFHCCTPDPTTAAIEPLETDGDPAIDIERVAVDEG